MTAILSAILYTITTTKALITAGTAAATRISGENGRN
jgi:hypothetical protein